MANGVIVQFAVVSVSVVMLIGALLILKKRKSEPPVREIAVVRPPVERSDTQTQGIRVAPVVKSVATDAAAPATPALPKESVNAAPEVSGGMTAAVVEKQPTFVLDLQGMAGGESRNDRILAGISENIKKSLQMRPMPQQSPLTFSESKPRNNEYVRVKKDIITPHGQIRFSILKDWMSTNMLAVFRRASLDWKTPEDLISLVPAYLEPEAEILNNQVLLIGTPGHNEKLAVPIRSLDTDSTLGNCFDFVSDARSESNAPAVLLPLDADFEVVSKGVITKTVFANVVEKDHSESLQKRYNAALRQMQPMVAEGVTE
jgi:hypothetical protein